MERLQAEEAAQEVEHRTQVSSLVRVEIVVGWYMIMGRDPTLFVKC